MAANSGDLVQSLIEGGLAPQAARILGNVLANANSPAFSKGQDEEDATPTEMLRLINSDARRYMLKNLDFTPQAPFQRQIESTVGQYAGPPPDHPYKDSQPVSSAAPLAAPRIQAGDYVSVDTQVDGNAAVSKVGLRLRLQDGNHLRIDPSTKFLDAVRFAARTETPQFLAAEFVDSGPETQLLVSLRNLTKTPLVLADGTQQEVWAFKEGGTSALGPGFLAAIGGAPSSALPSITSGTFSPTFVNINGPQAIIFRDMAVTSGSYTQINNLVFAQLRLKLSSRDINSLSATGALGIIGPPGTVGPAGVYAGSVGNTAGWNVAGTVRTPTHCFAQNLVSLPPGTGCSIMLRSSPENGPQLLVTTQQLGSTCDIGINVTYSVV